MKNYSGFPPDDPVGEWIRVDAAHREGGDWLAAARAWMQTNVRLGDTLAWSSAQPVTIPFCKLEDLALKVANHAVIEERRRASGRGTPKARFVHLMDELEKRFPHPNPLDSTKTPEAYVLEALDALLSSRPVALGQGWNTFDLGDTPPPADAFVIYRMLDGDLEMVPRNAGGLSWERAKEGEQPQEWEIIAYKVVA